MIDIILSTKISLGAFLYYFKCQFAIKDSLEKIVNIGFLMQI